MAQVIIELNEYERLKAIDESFKKGAIHFEVTARIDGWYGTAYRDINSISLMDKDGSLLDIIDFKKQVDDWETKYNNDMAAQIKEKNGLRGYLRKADIFRRFKKYYYP